MNTTRKPSCRFLSLLTALCLLLTIFPATAECPATPTDLGPVEEILGVPEGAEEQEDAGLKEEPPEAEPKAEPEPADPEAPPETDALPETDGQPETEATPEAEEKQTADPFPARLPAGTRLYADKDCYRKQHLLAEEAVILVVRTENGASEILYAYMDVSDATVPGRAFVHAADPQPLTEEETAAWLAADHAGSPERMGYPLETVAFGTEGEADKNRETEPEATAGAAAGENGGEKADQKTGEAP